MNAGLDVQQPIKKKLKPGTWWVQLRGAPYDIKSNLTMLKKATETLQGFADGTVVIQENFLCPDMGILGKRQSPEGQSQRSSLAETRKARLVEQIGKILNKYGLAELEGARQVFNRIAENRVLPVHSEAWPAFGI